MKRTPPANLPAPPAAVVPPSAEHAELALREVEVLMAPVALWLLRLGVSYPAFADVLKGVFVKAARAELERAGSKPTQSALSLLSGVHRKDVRELEDAASPRPAPPRPPLSSQVFTLWLTNPRYRGADGEPRTLPRSGGRRSFETLCREVSNDVHPRAVLDELLRLGLAALDGEQVVALQRSFVPAPSLEAMTSVFAANAADHIAAAVSNLTSSAPKFLEQGIYADGLAPESVELLHAAARQAWKHAFDSVVGAARTRVACDADSDAAPRRRIRFGAYFYSEPVAEAPPAGRTTPTRTDKKPSAPRRKKT